ncbi:MAG: PAS domain S-box protein [Candidatus Heimdallarchaeota archaeon]|nr:PAS domain S-box protein [Candidatus Heimdallarchaeota archaeon]
MFSINVEILRNISENIQVGISIVENGHHIFINKKSKEIYGITDEEENGNFSLLDYVVPEDADRVYKIINSSPITRDIPTELQFWIIRGDGERRYLDNKFIVFKGKEKTHTYLVLTTDCTEQEISLVALGASEKKFRELFNSTNDAIFLSRIRGEEFQSNFVEVNDFACSMLEYTTEELLELSSLDITAPEEKKTNKEIIQQIIKKEQVTFKTMLTSKTGKNIPVEIKSHFFNLEREKVILTVARDITECRKAEEEIKNLNASLKIINSILRHDLNNNLSIIMGAITTYEDVKEHILLEMTLKAAQKSFELIKKMEELERTLIQKEDITEVDSEELFSRIISSYSLANVTFEIEGSCNLYVDAAFTSVIDNIISNAIKHGQADKIKISINSDHGFCTIRIADNGSGILDGHKKHVFERSFKHGTTAGTGLGLYIVKKVIERYGGEITLKDNYPKGTIFEIKLKNREGKGF